MADYGVPPNPPYDPAYLRSIDRNFVKFGQAALLELDDIDTNAFEQAAAKLMAMDGAA